jgi:hypothetical protein
MATASEALAKMAAKGSPDGRLPDSKGGSKGRGGKGPYKRDDKNLALVSLKRQLPTWPKKIVERAFELMDEHRSVHAAQCALAVEMEEMGLKGPPYSALWRWAKERTGILETLTVDKKAELVAVTSEVAMKAGERMLTALDGISDSQAGVYYGIAMDKRIGWENIGKQNTMNVQFNLVTRDSDK